LRSLFGPRDALYMLVSRALRHTCNRTRPHAQMVDEKLTLTLTLTLNLNL